MQDPFNALCLGLLLTFLIWYVQYHWKRKRLYYFASQSKGPPALPLLGNALYFVGSNSGEYTFDIGLFAMKILDILYNMVSLNDRYKTPFRIWLGSKLFFFVANPNDLEVVMNSQQALEKGALYKFCEVAVGTGLFTAPPAKWKRHRKIIMPTFNQKILDDFVPIFVQQSNILLEQLKKELGNGEIDIFQYVSRCSLDIICETAMGVTIEAQTTDSNYVRWVNRGMEITLKRMLNIWYHPDLIFNLTSYAKECEDLIGKIHQFTNIIVKEKRETYQKKLEERSAKRKTFLEQLIELSENGTKFTDEELREEVDTFMVAGSETTASADCFFFIMLAMYPEIQEKVYKEVLDVLGPDRSVEYTDLNKFCYMERVLRETMRIFPVGPMLLRATNDDIQLEKCTIPAGSSIVLFIIGLHWNDDIWPDPFKFDPDRFLPEEVAKRHPYSWLPFSGGLRSCVGPKYAFMAIKVLVATVVRKYKFTTQYKKIEDIKLKMDMVLKPVDGYKVAIELRN